MLNLNIMRMVCDSTFIIDQSTRYQTKIDEVIDIINDAIEGSDTKIVVFSQWERMARLLSFELEKRGIDFEFLHGGVPSKKRKDLMDNFTDNPQSRVFISTDAGATGLNLQAASLLINLDLPWNPAVLEQRIARIYRIGQKRNIQVINMVARDSIEERMLSTLNFKSGLFAGILDAGEDAIFLENSKFDKIVDTFADVVEPTQQDAPQSETQPEVQSESQSEALCEPRPESQAQSDSATEPQPEQPQVAEPASTLKQVPAPEQSSNSHKAESQQQPQASTSDSQQPSSQTGRQQAGDVINQGITFFKGLSEILSDEAKTKELVDTIVHTDESTGETAIHIPVSDKATVQTIFSALSKLFAK
jgi:superfamily II DNA/RNA helicase